MILKLLALSVLLATTATPVTAQQNEPKKNSAPKKELTREEIAKLGGFEPAPDDPVIPAIIQVELVVIAVPKSEVLTLAAELKNPDTAETAYTKLTTMVKNKSARLIGCPSVETRSGNRCVIENITEVRYAIEFAPIDGEKAPALDKQPAPAKDLPLQAPAAVGVLPSSFETRNAGLTLELEAILGADGKTIEMQCAPQHVELLGWDVTSVEKDGQLVQRIPQPRFHTNKVSTNITIQAGQRVLAGVFESGKDPETMELFLLKAGTRGLKKK